MDNICGEFWHKLHDPRANSSYFITCNICFFCITLHLVK